MRNEKKTNNNATSVKVAGNARNAKHNIKAVSNLLDAFDKHSLSSALNKVLDTYLVSDDYAYLDQSERVKAYEIGKTLLNFIKSVRTI